MSENNLETYDTKQVMPTQRSMFPAKIALGMGYVPFQPWEKTYTAEVGLDRGTLFPSLDLPFIGEEAVPRG